MADEAPAERVQPEKIAFHYLKSPHYRTIHADGAFGGLAPRGALDVSFYAERVPIPNYLEHHITPEGRLGGEISGSRVSKSGVIREVEVGVVFDLDSARAFLKWFQGQVDKWEEIVKGEET